VTLVLIGFTLFGTLILASPHLPDDASGHIGLRTVGLTSELHARR
jgi:hypothetical protein